MRQKGAGMELECYQTWSYAVLHSSMQDVLNNPAIYEMERTNTTTAEAGYPNLVYGN
jgi:hypothetical protein